MIPRAIFTRTLLRRSAYSTSNRTIQTLTRPRQTPILHSTRARYASHTPHSNTLHSTTKFLSSQSLPAADEKINDITELYATAQDEFEIASEETEKMSVYAEEDRKAAREELTKVQEAYKAVIEGEDQTVAEEVKRRIGQRIRELEQGVAAMEEKAQNQD